MCNTDSIRKSDMSFDISDFLSEVRTRAENIPELMNIFVNCYSDTLETALTKQADGTIYMITGDIPAMWLRDSSAQMRPYLIPAKTNAALRETIAGLVRKQFFYIGLDPYANAFNATPSGACWDQDDLCSNPWVWERKYELDSLCYPIQLAYLLWKTTGCTAQFDDTFQNGIQKVLDVMRIEQYHEEKSDYRFVRQNSSYLPTETLSRDGKGSLTKSGIGLIWSGFRPSDDACTYGYLIPSNMFAVVVLGYLAEIEETIFHDTALAQAAESIRKDVHRGIEIYGKARTKDFGLVYAYEADGYGMFHFMDDANVPSLLSMEYLGYPGDPEVMQNTRRFVLSDGNPFYYEGRIASGIGSPHTHVGRIWHIAMAVQGLTSQSAEEKLRILQLMASTTGGKQVMHESFSCDDDSVYSREWFSWANAMFAELFLDYLGFHL